MGAIPDKKEHHRHYRHLKTSPDLSEKRLSHRKRPEKKEQRKEKPTNSLKQLEERHGLKKLISGADHISNTNHFSNFPPTQNKSHKMKSNDKRVRRLSSEKGTMFSHGQDSHTLFDMDHGLHRRVPEESVVASNHSRMDSQDLPSPGDGKEVASSPLTQDGTLSIPVAKPPPQPNHLSQTKSILPALDRASFKGSDPSQGISRTSQYIPIDPTDHLETDNSPRTRTSSQYSGVGGGGPLLNISPAAAADVSDLRARFANASSGGSSVSEASLHHAMLAAAHGNHQDRCDPPCVEGSECVHLNHKNAWECICDGQLYSPENGCDPVSEGTPVYEGIQGVLSADHHRAIADYNEKNSGTTNQTQSSMFRQPTDTPQPTGHLPEVVIPVVSCVVVILLLGLFGCLYRRRRKLLYVKSKRDSILRNNDGAMLLDNMNTITKNPTYFYQSADGGRRFNTRVVPAEYVKLGEVVGEGAFGQVFKGEMTSADSDITMQVAVKILKEGASHEAQEDFEREVEIMSAFDHDNILKLLGVVAQGTEGNPYMIFEFMEHGDLTELLRRNDPYQHHVTSSATPGGVAVAGAVIRPGGAAAPSASVRAGGGGGGGGGQHLMLTKTDLVDISVQIASGMSYLACQHFVHRDLATRNCLVGSGLVVKISDFGMSRDIYTNDYYRIGGSRMLPVRWMSPEAIKYGRFTCESDIWAFGVVLWEIFSFGKQPYYGHSNEEVIHFLDQGILLQRPEDCPSTIYHVMIGCWKRDPRQRIIFERLVKYLSDYRNRLMTNQRQHRQLQHHQQQQQQQQKLQLQQEQQQQQKRQQHGQQKDTLNCDSGECSPNSERTEMTDFAETPDEINTDSGFPSIPAKSNQCYRQCDPHARKPIDYRQGVEQRRQSSGDVQRSGYGSTLQAHTGTKSDANLHSTPRQALLPLAPIPSHPPPPQGHIHRSLSFLNNGREGNTSVFRSNSSRTPISPRIIKGFCSKVEKKAESYSTLVASGGAQGHGRSHDRACAKEPRRRYSSGEVGEFEVAASRKDRRKLSCTSPAEVTGTTQCTSKLTVCRNSGRKGREKGGLLMDKMNAGSKKQSSALNSYETSLSCTPSLRNFEMLSASNETDQRPKRFDSLESSSSSRLGPPGSIESRSTGVRMEWIDTGSSMLRRAQSQREPLIANTSPALTLR